LKFADVPAQDVVLEGLAVTVGAVVTVSVAALLFVTPQLFVNAARYWFPFALAPAVNV
jgi:hypothetical protein